MYPPDALVRFSKRFLMLSIRPGKERTFWWLAVSGFVFVPAAVVGLAVLFTSPGVPSDQMAFTVGAALSGAAVFCSAWGVLTEGKRPLLSAWLGVASLGTFVLAALTYGLAAYLWLGWIAAAGWGLLAIAPVAADVYRGRSQDSG